MLKPLSKWKVVMNIWANLNSVILLDYRVGNLNFKIFYSFCSKVFIFHCLVEEDSGTKPELTQRCCSNHDFHICN